MISLQNVYDFIKTVVDRVNMVGIWVDILDIATSKSRI